MNDTIITALILVPCAWLVAAAARIALRAPRLAGRVNTLLDTTSSALAAWMTQIVHTLTERELHSFVEGYELGEADATRRTATSTQTKAAQLAELVGIHLLPWQTELLASYMNDDGQTTVHVAGRQTGRSTVRALTELVDTLRNPPQPPVHTYELKDDGPLGSWPTDGLIQSRVAPLDIEKPLPDLLIAWMEAHDGHKLPEWQRADIIARYS